MTGFNEWLWKGREPEFLLKESTCLSPQGLRIWRFIAMCIELGIWIWTDISFGGIIIYFEYLTFWGVQIVLAYFIISNIAYSVYKEDDGENKNRVRRLYNWQVVIFEIAFSAQILIPIFFWCFLYQGLTQDHSGANFYATVCDHFITGLLMWLEMAFNKIPFYRHHLVIILTFFFVYGIDNFLVTTITGVPVYQPITYQNLYTVAFLAMGTFLIVMGFFLGVFITKKKGITPNIKKNVLTDSSLDPTRDV